MVYKKYGDTYIIRLDIGDERMESLKEFCRNEGVAVGSVSGIGTTNHAKIGLLDTETKEYHPQEFHQDMEIVSLKGTVSEMNDESYIHLHIAVAPIDHNVIGGHLDFAYVSAVAEIFLRPLPGKTNRKFSSEAGVNLLQFE
jgi:predicted DNA-binding protein with PD1-like motif